MVVVQRKSGITLVELLIVLTIIGVLGSIILPSYQQFVSKANRAAAHQFLLEVANLQHQYFSANGGIGFASQAELFGVDGDACSQKVGLIKASTTVCKYYNFTITLSSGDREILLIANPSKTSGMMSGNVNRLIIDTNGQGRSDCDDESPPVCGEIL